MREPRRRTKLMVPVISALNGSEVEKLTQGSVSTEVLVAGDGARPVLSKTVRVSPAGAVAAGAMAAAVPRSANIIMIIISTLTAKPGSGPTAIFDRTRYPVLY